MNFTLTDNSLSLRRVNDNDIPLLFTIYSSTREQEMQMLANWTHAQKHTFVSGQFNAQHTYYTQQYCNADFFIIYKSGQPIGRLYLDENRKKSIRIIDITLLPVNRNKGTGTAIFQDIFQYARTSGKSVTIHVESFNPALNLYKRLGFEIIDETNGVYYLMEHCASNLALQQVSC